MAGAKKARKHDEAYLQIGEVSERTGVTQRTLRFYEERGLLATPTRMEGGFRLYSEADVERVAEIRRLQNLLNLSLAEIKDIVDAQEVLTTLRATYRPDREIEERLERISQGIAMTERQRDIIAEKLVALQTMLSDLDTRLERFKSNQASLKEQLASRKQKPPKT